MIESFWVDHGQKWVWPVWRWDSEELTVIEEWTDGINWFFACWYMITRIESCSKILWVCICQKWVWPVWPWDSKIDCISKMNRWNKVIFSCWYQFREAKSWINDFWVGKGKNGHGVLVCKTLKFVVSTTNYSIYSNLSYSFTFKYRGSSEAVLLVLYQMQKITPPDCWIEEV